MNVVVTGGAGFIGSHVANELISRGHEVTVIDDLSTGKIENIPSQCHFIHGTILDLSLLESSFFTIDTVFHYAAIASIPRSIKDPVTTNEVNITGTLNVLIASAKNYVRKLLFASSGAVYGDGLDRKESMATVPRSPYTLSKLAGEQYCTLYNDLSGLKTVCLRFFNVYGGGMNPKSDYALAVPAFIDRVARGLPLVIYGDGDQTRDFIFIDDVVNASIYAVMQDNMQGVYNVGTGVTTSINRLAELISGGQAKILHEAARPGELRHNTADITKLKKAGFTPQWSLDKGLRRVMGK